MTKDDKIRIHRTSKDFRTQDFTISIAGPYSWGTSSIFCVLCACLCVCVCLFVSTKLQKMRRSTIHKTSKDFKAKNFSRKHFSKDFNLLCFTNIYLDSERFWKILKDLTSKRKEFILLLFIFLNPDTHTLRGRWAAKKLAVSSPSLFFVALYTSYFNASYMSELIWSSVGYGRYMA